MKDDSFILVSLKDGKSKKLAQILTNDSSRLILDYLGKKEEATETQIAKELNLPVSTVHYNIKHLSEAGFIIGDEYHYSEKGKEVIHYKLANKFIIIAPKTTFGFKQKLRNILPIAIIAGGVSVLLKLITSFNLGTVGFSKMSQDLASSAPQSEARVMKAAFEEAMPATGARLILEDSVQNTVVQETSKYSLYSDLALWFFFGVLFTLLLIMMFEWFRSKKNK